jgi:simple sugar transport system ATP-binding protein
MNDPSDSPVVASGDVSLNADSSTRSDPEARTALVLEARNVSKHFGGVAALSSANFTLAKGEVHAIVGDNGAGKSTLLKIIAGAHSPDSGDIFINGKKVVIPNPRAAQHLGVTTVFQDLGLVDDLDASANLFLGRELYYRPPLSWFGVLNKKVMRAVAKQHISRLNIAIPSVDQLLGTMSGGQRQAVAVCRAIAFGTTVIIMDEPTAALGVRETAAVLDMIRRLHDEGLSIAMVSHNLSDVFAVAQRMTIIRNGRTVLTTKVSDVTLEEIVRLMTAGVANAPS